MSLETIERIGFCGVDCSICPDYTGNKCPGCRKSTWDEGDECPPIACCKKKDIPYCGACDVFPCEMMAGFYEESESHRQAFERMKAVKK